MTTAVRQTVTVQADGRLEVIAPELREGTVTDVIVLLPTDAPAGAVVPPLTPEERVAEWDRLRAEVNITAEQAEQWIKEIQAEREAWRLPGEEQD